MFWGLAPDVFWTVTPREVGLILAGAERRETARVRQATQLVYAQARLTAFAHHQPGKMPSYEKFFGGTSEMTQAETFAALRGMAAVHNEKLRKAGQI